MIDTITLTFTGTNFTPYNKSTNLGMIGTNMSIDWGDGNIENINSRTKLPSHTYSVNDTYTITITGSTITEIGQYCFYNLTGITNIVIPDSIIRLGNMSFGECRGLTNIIIPNSVTYIGISCFNSCQGLTSVIIPNNVTYIGESCFSGCGNLTNVVLPDNLTTLPSKCFSGCDSLTNIIISNNITDIGASCFSNCDGLTNVIIPNNVTHIGESCFSNCRNLTSVVLSNNLTTLPSKCFNYSYNLVKIIFKTNIPPTSMSNTFINIPTTCKFIVPKGSLNGYANAENYPSSDIYTYLEYSLALSFVTLGELLAKNLTIMGVEADASDGLTTLVNKILDIEK